MATNVLTTQKTGGAAVAEQSNNQALTKQRTEIITTPAQFEEAIQKWTGNYHLLSAFTQITGLAAQHGLIASVVKINPDTSKNGPGEVYDGMPFLKEGEVAIAKIGLRKIAEAAGISTTTIRTDPRTIRDYWEFKAIASYRGIDGTTVTREATSEWDLRADSNRLKGWKPDQITEGRKNGLRNAETRAINAAIRELGIKQKYTREELKKPFLVLRCAFQPDFTDPEQRRIVTENAMRGTSVLYGHGPALPAHGEVVDADVVEQPRHVGAGAADTTAAAKTDEKPDPNKPPADGAVRVADVKPKDGETNGRKWTRYIIIDSHGEECSTFDKKLAEAAAAAKASQAWVELVCERNGEYRNLIEIIPAGSEPKLPDLGNL